MAKAQVGQRNATSVFAGIDLAPSLAALAGAKPDAATKLDGQDLSATLLGKATSSHTEPLCWSRPPDRKTWGPALPNPAPDLAIRDGDWKLLCEYDGSKPLLYDLKRDPGESRDLAATEPTTVERLTRAVLAWHRTMPPDNGAALGAASPTGKKK
jgi:arylsulfatase A-like enzyme